MRNNNVLNKMRCFYNVHVRIASVLIACLLLLSLNEWVSLTNAYCDYDNGEGVSFIVKAITMDTRYIIEVV